MGRPRKPVDLILHENRSHFTKDQLAEKRRLELRVDLKDVNPPEYLPAKLQEEFNVIAGKLLILNIMTELDEDTLARYLLAKQNYLQYTSMLNKATRENKLMDMERISVLQDKAFKQCRSCASDLGLTISSRCKMVVPKVNEQPKVNKFAKFGTG